MRIIGGQWKGRALAELGEGDQAAHLRPSSDRYRETLFNILQSRHYFDDFSEIRSLDLFAGTGALSFEALSRGAKFATLVDNGQIAQKLIRENIKRLKCPQSCEISRKNATDLGPCPSEKYNLIFLDPPYSQGLGERAIESAKTGNWLADNAIIIWEEEVAPRLPFYLTQLDERKIGRATLTIAKYEGH